MLQRPQSEEKSYRGRSAAAARPAGGDAGVRVLDEGREGTGAVPRADGAGFCRGLPSRRRRHDDQQRQRPGRRAGGGEGAVRQAEGGRSNDCGASRATRATAAGGERQTGLPADRGGAADQGDPDPPGRSVTAGRPRVVCKGTVMTRKFFFFSEMGYNAYPSEVV